MVEVWDVDLGGRRTRSVVFPEYLCVLSLGLIVITPTVLSMSNFAQFFLGAREQGW